MTRLLLPLLVASAFLVPTARAGEKRTKHLRFQPTYADALLEAHVRNVPVFVSRHKDECGRCTRQYKKVLTNAAFVKWARENVLVLIAHNEMLHDPVEVKGADGETRDECPLYPGMTCRQHVHASVDIDTARGEALVKVPFLELCPNSWLVLPNDEVLRIEEQDQFDPKRIREIVEGHQEALGAPLTRKQAKPVLVAFAGLLKAEEDEDWRAALEALAAVASAVPEPAPSLRKLVAGHFAELDENVEIDVEDILEAEAVGEEERAAARKLLEATDVAVYGEHLPSRARLVAWLARNP